MKITSLVIIRALVLTTVVSLIPGVGSSSAAEFTPGHLLVSDSSSIYLVNPASGASNVVVTGFTSLGDVVYNPVTRSAFAVVGTNIIQIKATSTGYITAPFLNGIQDLECLAVDNFGRVIFNKADFVQHRLWRAELDGTSSFFTAASLFVPHHISFADDFSKLYSFETPANRVSVVAYPSGSISTLASGLDFPPGGDADAAGNVYVLEDFSSAKISKITPGGVRTTYASQAWMNFVYDDLEYDSITGTIYATSTSGLYALSPDLSNQKLFQGAGWFGGLSMVRPVALLIAQQPQSVVAAPGSNVGFNVSLISGAATYQWRRNGTNIVGATGPTLNLPGITTADAGVYSVLVKTSSSAELSVEAFLTILEFAVKPVVTLTGPIGARYQIEYAEFLHPANWQVLMNVTAGESPMDIVDHTAANASKRFYRVSLLP